MVVRIRIIITVAEDVAVRRRLRFQREVNRTCSTRRNVALQSTQVRISDRFIRGGGELTPATFRQSLKTHLFSVYQYDSTFSAIRVSHVMRSINAQYLLTYLLIVCLSQYVQQRSHRYSIVVVQHQITTRTTVRLSRPPGF